MSDCGKGCSEGCVPVGPMGHPGPKGDPGTNGVNGISVVASFVSDGVTAIGNVIYPLNTLVHQLSNGNYISAGLINIPPPATIQWLDLPLINGWTPGTGINVPKYAIFNGFLYFRGIATHSGATDSTFATVASLGFTNTISSCVSTNSVGISNIPSALLSIDSLGNIAAFDSSGIPEGTALLLDSISPINIR